MSKLKKRAIEAAARYLGRRGCEVLEKNWRSDDGGAIDLVARDDGEIVFCDVYARREIDKGMPDDGGEGSRERREVNAAKWLAEHAGDCIDRPVRFDTVSLLVVADSCAFLRHHINCLGGGVIASSAD